MVQRYDAYEDRLDPPLLNQYEQWSEQIEGSGLRAVRVHTSWSGQDAAEELILVHGGAYSDGSYEAGVWLGRALPAQGEERGTVEWTGPIVPEPEGGGAPLGRARGVLLARPAAHDSAVLFGGESAEGLLGDLWVFSAEDRRWNSRRPRPVGWSPQNPQGSGEVPSPRAEVGYAQSGNRERAYLFGGVTENGWSDELFVMHVDTLRFERLWPQEPPGNLGLEPRYNASVTLDERRGRVLVYGGQGDWGPLNDLWAFDLQTRTWELLSPEQCYGVCPPPTRGAVAVWDGETGRARVVLGSADFEYARPTWSFARTGGWTHTDSDAQTVTRDCYGDGYEDPYHGLLCQTGWNWWATLGVLRCSDNYLACSAPETQGVLVGQVPLDNALELIMTGGHAVALLEDRIQGLSLSYPGSPMPVGSALLSGSARDLLTYDERGYVAAGDALEVADLQDPLAPTMVGQATLLYEPHSVARIGSDTIVASTRCGLSVIDVSTPESPQELSFFWLSRTANGWEGSSNPGECFAYATDPLPITSAGNMVVLGTEQSVLVVDLSFPEAPELAGWVDTYEPVAAMRIAGRGLYSVSSEDASYGQVLDISRPAEPELLGYHDVGYWVLGTVVRGSWAYRTRSWGIEVAELEP